MYQVAEYLLGKHKVLSTIPSAMHKKLFLGILTFLELLQMVLLSWCHSLFIRVGSLGTFLIHRVHIRDKVLFPPFLLHFPFFRH
jgi:hypothetical protein